MLSSLIGSMHLTGRHQQVYFHHHHQFQAQTAGSSAGPAGCLLCLDPRLSASPGDSTAVCLSARGSTLLGCASPAAIAVARRVRNFDAVRAAVEYSRPKDFLEVEYLLDVVDVLLPRAVAGLAVLLRHVSPGRLAGRTRKPGTVEEGREEEEEERRGHAAGGPLLSARAFYRGHRNKK